MTPETLTNHIFRPTKPSSRVRQREKQPNKPNLSKAKFPGIHRSGHKHQKLGTMDDDESIASVSDSDSTSEDEFYDYEAGAGPKGRDNVSTGTRVLADLCMI